jgi:hypothetical protein
MTPGGAVLSQCAHPCCKPNQALGENMMNIAAVVRGEDDNLVTVFLTCVSCGKTKEIRVRRERELPGKIYWECLDCQKRDRLAVRTRPV